MILSVHTHSITRLCKLLRQIYKRLPKDVYLCPVSMEFMFLDCKNENVEDWQQFDYFGKDGQIADLSIDHEDIRDSSFEICPEKICYHSKEYNFAPVPPNYKHKSKSNDILII